MAQTRFQRFGNDLYSGKRTINFVGGRKVYLTISAVLMILCILVLVFKGVNWGIDFRGGTQFQVPNSATTNQSIALDAVRSVDANAVVQVTIVNGNGVRVTTDALPDAELKTVTDKLAAGYQVDSTTITSSLIGPSWGADISRQALTGLGVFLALAFVGMALYFRTWKMSISAIVTLFHDLLFTAGVYALVGFEVTPATVIGFLTILAYSLYDTVVVFDKIRENTREDQGGQKRIFGESVNLAVNQTLVRSINTAVVAALPVGGILFIGALVLGASTLQDISLSLFIGILIGTYSTIFVAAPLYSWMREGEPKIVKHDKRVLGLRAKAPLETDGAAAAR
ncbi:protein translocase subunit SecF [Gryllotalpicola sp.]|uniref:protein translocase subunit SecF n=1 Tax=Gryllotalpicola sp. TaxID=1932787 RepID=UPI0026209FB4|nr:protein translocase subunit SecF [Gryllotalpicola sp.]